MATMRTSIHGRRLGLGASGELISNEKRITSPALGVTIAVATASTSPRPITLQVTDTDGNALAEITRIGISIYTTAAMTAYSTGASTGLAASVGLLDTVTASAEFVGTTNSSGAMTLSWTDTGTAACIIVVTLPNGCFVVAPVVNTIGV